MSLKLTPFQKQKLRFLGAMHAALRERTQGLSSGLSTRRGEMMMEAQRDVIKTRQALDQAESYAQSSKNESFIANDLPRRRERQQDAVDALEQLKAEAVTIEEQLEAARTDSEQSGKVFDALLKYSERN